MASTPRPVLIIGAGINGAALARELVLNHVPVVLVDRADIASGTTAYSSRLIHGGLRYLEYGELDLVRESVEERTRWLKLAPQYVKPLKLFIPVERRLGGLVASARRVIGWESRRSNPSSRGLFAIAAGLRLYDAYARDPNLERFRVHRVNEAGLPPVNDRKYRWLCSYIDAQIVYPERFTLALVEDAKRAAAESGSTFEVFTYHQVTLNGATAVISPIGQPEKAVATFPPSAVVNATGAWVDMTLSQLKIQSKELMGGTKGSHLIVQNDKLQSTLAGRAMYAAAADGRPIFVLPFIDGTLIGTTDERFDGDPGNAVATGVEIEYLVSAVNDLFPRVQLTESQVSMHYSGVRPLPRSDSSRTAAISRRHWLEENSNTGMPFYSIIGGKLTTCRSLAEGGAAVLLKRLAIPKRSDSRDRPLPGSERYPATQELLSQELADLAEATQTTVDQVYKIWLLLGTRTGEAMSTQYDWRIKLPDVDLPEAMARWSIDREMAYRLTDLVERRLMLLYDPLLSRACLVRLSELLVEAGKLSIAQANDEVDAAVHRLTTHFGKTVR